MTLRKFFTWIAIGAACVSGPYFWYIIDRRPPLIYLEGRFVNPRGIPGTTDDLYLKIDWPRPNCWTELSRYFEDSEGALHKIETVLLGPPPSGGIRESTRPVLIPAGRSRAHPNGMAPGRARYLPWATMRCPGGFINGVVDAIWPLMIPPPAFDIMIEIKPVEEGR